MNRPFKCRLMTIFNTRAIYWLQNEVSLYVNVWGGNIFAGLETKGQKVVGRKPIKRSI